MAEGRLKHNLGQLRQSRLYRRLFLLAADAGAVFLAYVLAYWLRLDAFFSGFWPSYRTLLMASLPFIIGLRLAANWLWRLYNWSFSHAGGAELLRLLSAVLTGTAAFIALNVLFRPFGQTPPRSIYALEFCLSLIFMVLARFSPKYIYDFYCGLHTVRRFGIRPTLIYGAGGNAEILIRELRRTIGHPYRLEGLIDDAPSKRDVYIAGLKVLGDREDLPKIIAARGITEILVTITGFSGAPLRRLVELCEPFGLSYKVVPPYQSVLSARRDLLQTLETIRPEALIGRPAIDFDQERLRGFYQGREVLVTGAAGSIGSEIARQLAALGVSRLTVLDQDENGLFFLLKDLKRLRPDRETASEIGSVRDEGLWRAVLARRRPDMVIHAAAHKHVPLMEEHPLAAVKNNVLGTIVTAEAALAAGVEHFLLISTDKAVAPANVMGASKRLAEMAVQTMAGGPLKPTIVRFGNVLGSNGSLLPIIQRQIQRGGPVTVTDRKMTRFFMTIPEAIGLVLVTPTLARRDIFVLEMGAPVNIDQLVRQVIALAGLVPGRDIEIIYTEKRPGEKLSEELFLPGDDLSPTEHKGILGLSRGTAPLALAGLKSEIEALGAAPDPDQAARRFLAARVPEYSLENQTI
jgi:FlaA1/EpsC-like NDP-sugar epimerase